MKYKAGDKVRLKKDDSVYKPEYHEDVKKFNHIATIIDYSDEFGSGWYYKFVGHEKWWNEVCIIGIYQNPKDIINSRFDILDL